MAFRDKSQDNAKEEHYGDTCPCRCQDQWSRPETRSKLLHIRKLRYQGACITHLWKTKDFVEAKTRKPLEGNIKYLYNTEEKKDLLGKSQNHQSRRAGKPHFTTLECGPSAHQKTL